MKTVRLGVLDWGIGGIPTFAAVRQRWPALDITYWSDNGVAPYGLQPADVLATRFGEVAGRMDVTHLIVACNAASTVLDGAGVSCEVTGVIRHGIAGAIASGGRTVGVIGGERTILSGTYQRGLRDVGLGVVAVVAQPLSAHVEAGRLDGPAVVDDVARVARKVEGVDALILGCTHYPALSPVIQRCFRACPSSTPSTRC